MALNEEHMQLLIDSLHERHPAITPEIGSYFFQAACVLMNRHHGPTTTATLSVEFNDEKRTARLNWSMTDQRAQIAWGDQSDLIEAGAVAIALDVILHLTGMCAIARADRKSGADYLLARPETAEDDYEAITRFEVSGIGDAPQWRWRSRLNEKLDQLDRGQSSRPGIAAVVEFGHRIVLARSWEDRP